jgi:hypothetical protein
VDRRTNPEIAEALFLSPRTVETHLRNLFHKLDVSSRAEVARGSSDPNLWRAREGTGKSWVSRYAFLDRELTHATFPATGTRQRRLGPAM